MSIPAKSALQAPRPRSAAPEEARFQQAWAKRPEHDPRYARSNARHVLVVQERERAVVELRHDVRDDNVGVADAYRAECMGL